MLHFVYFDGTSAFVDDANFVCDEDTTVLFKTNNFDEACQYVDDYNGIRPHEALGYEVPDKLYFNRFAA